MIVPVRSLIHCPSRSATPRVAGSIVHSCRHLIGTLVLLRRQGQDILPSSPWWRLDHVLFGAVLADQGPGGIDLDRPTAPETPIDLLRPGALRPQVRRIVPLQALQQIAASYPPWGPGLVRTPLEGGDLSGPEAEEQRIVGNAHDLGGLAGVVPRVPVPFLSHQGPEIVFLHLLWAAPAMGSAV